MLNESHTYDFKLADTKLELEKHLVKIKKLPKNEKLTVLGKLGKKLEGMGGLPNFHVLVADYIRGNMKNYDPSNSIDASDLLCLCSELSNVETCSKDVIELTSIQLEEINGGPCPIGRVARLLQVVYSFSEFL